VPLTNELLASRVLAAMKAAGMSQRALGAAIGLDPPTMSKALSGKRGFRPMELALISEAVGVPVQRLLADEQQAARESVLARVQPDSSPAVEHALSRARRMLELNDLLSELGFAPTAVRRPQRPSHGQPHQQGEVLAERLRSQAGLDDADLPADLALLAADVESRFAVDVAIEPLARGLDGLAVTRGDYSLILVSSSVAAHRQRYTIAHELGHIMAGDHDEVVDENINFSPSPAETCANAFAAAFLMPTGALRTAIGSQPAVSEEFVAELLARYRVSLDAVAFRLHNLNLVNASGRDAVRRMSSARIALRQGRAADLQSRQERRAPGGLLARTVEAYVTGQISIRPIAQLLDVDADTLLEELSPPKLPPPGSPTSGGPDILYPML
jgi:Zn-dependent peptidase ImmA (M78 family)/lambda repressor-like predicted transcriptional regulator